MRSVDDFRLGSYKLLLELDAATTGMMMLVTSSAVSGAEWDSATQRHREACRVWNNFLSEGADKDRPSNVHDFRGNGRIK